jgi:RNA polymerase sigma-70 factor (ECF subfamily)
MPMLDPARHSGIVTTPEAAEATVIEVRRLVGEYYRNVYRYAYRLCGNEADAEDLTQQTFLVVQAKLHQLRDAAKVQQWIFAVLRSCFLKSRRRPRPVAAANLELDVDEVPEHRIAGSTLDQQELQQELDDLPEEFRLVVFMFYFEELSYKEIADRLKIKIGTVMSRLSRAKCRLRQRWFDQEPPSSNRSEPKVSAK